MVIVFIVDLVKVKAGFFFSDAMETVINNASETSYLGISLPA